jgi:dTDP-4-dehydrorhamnose 3,5-epimerase
MKEFGWNDQVKQINFSQTSKKGTVRGMHMQFSKYSEYKLVTCIKGSIFDVAVDLRKESQTFLSYYSIQLDQINKLSLMIPPGFAHGFQAIEEDSQIIYTHSKEYHKDYEGGFTPIDPDIKVQWPLPVVELSDRDKNLPFLKDLIQSNIL